MESRTNQSAGVVYWLAVVVLLVNEHTRARTHTQTDRDR